MSRMLLRSRTMGCENMKQLKIWTQSLTGNKKTCTLNTRCETYLYNHITISVRVDDWCLSSGPPAGDWLKPKHHSISPLASVSHKHQGHRSVAVDMEMSHEFKENLCFMEVYFTPDCLMWTCSSLIPAVIKQQAKRAYLCVGGSTR